MNREQMRTALRFLEEHRAEVFGQYNGAIAAKLELVGAVHSLVLGGAYDSDCMIHMRVILTSNAFQLHPLDSEEMVSFAEILNEIGTMGSRIELPEGAVVWYSELPINKRIPFGDSLEAWLGYAESRILELMRVVDGARKVPPVPDMLILPIGKIVLN